MSLQFKIAEPQDAVLIAQLHTESWRSAYRGILKDSFLDGDILQNRLEVWEKRFVKPSPNQHIIIAENVGEPIGFVCIYGADDDTWGSLVDNLHVLPHLKGQGIGQLLLQKAMDWSKEHYPQSGIYLWVYEDNHAARQFYKKMGSQEADAHLHDNPGGGTANAIRCVWK